MPDITIDAGTLTANRTERIVTGLLVPFGEECASNLGRFTFDAGVLDLPQDLTGMSLNVEHERERVVGAPVILTQDDRGVVATFRIASTPAGDQALDDIATGRRRHLSAEVANVRIKDGRGVAGRLFAAALVEHPAFPSATLLAAAADTDDRPADTDVDRPAEDPDQPADADRPDEPADRPADEDTPEAADTEPADDQEEDGAMPDPTVPATLQATDPARRGPSLNEVFEAITNVRKGQDPTGTLLAVLSDIKVSGAGALPIAGVLQPAWLGELWSGRAYVRKIMPLIRNGAIRAIDEKGFNVTVPAVQPWAGNKSDIASGTGSTTLSSSVFQPWGIAFDIAREFFDIPGNNEVIDAFLRGVTESYARVTDEWTNDQLVGSATIVAPGTYPTDYPSALGKLIQGIAAVEDAGDTPTFAIANDLAWTELLYTPRDKVPEFITFTVGTDSTGTADGRVRVVKGSTGIDDTSSVLVGSSAAAHVNELPGASPLNLDALDLARGGVDRAVIGYTQYLADHPEGLVIVGTADAPAAAASSSKS